MKRRTFRPKPGSKMIVCPDTHWASPDCEEGGIDPQAASCFVQAIHIVKPDIYCHIGDAGEWNPASHWKYKRRKRPPLEYIMAALRKEVVAVNDGLDTHCEALDAVGCKTRIMVEGNHEVWIDNLIEEEPAYATAENPHGKPGWSPDKLMKLRERGMIYIPYGEIFRVGKLGLYHGGHFSVQHHAYRHVTEWGISILYGHTHDQTTAKKSTLDVPIGGWSIGCLCKMDKPFLKGRPTRWSHNFAIVHFGSGGTFNVEIVEIFEGKCYVWGREIVG